MDFSQVKNSKCHVHKTNCNTARCHVGNIAIFTAITMTFVIFSMNKPHLKYRRDIKRSGEEKYRRKEKISGGCAYQTSF